MCIRDRAYAAEKSMALAMTLDVQEIHHPPKAQPRKSQALCHYWKSGTCRRGDQCRFKHVGQPGKQPAATSHWQESNKAEPTDPDFKKMDAWFAAKVAGGAGGITGLD
eukprot:TRINITY_DN55649_c0_g1_i2.p2 TRINITY_DN55649_c0_g1~~TRINITY_DN55649_c0_g1_i2.p2  ORF type:complete len:108 (-),score=31.88 TRINITY_DN55649_c0_g1_i2:334-657(-)